MSDAPNSGKVRAEALRIAENEKPPTSHATYPTKAILEGESRRRAVFQYAEGIARGRTITAEQVEAAAEVLAEMTGEPRAGRFERTMTRAAFRAAGLIMEDE